MVRLFFDFPIEKSYFPYDLTSVCSQVPVLDDVQDVTLAETLKNELVALFSCGNKAPPQLWKLEIVRNGETGKEHSRLTLRYDAVFFSCFITHANEVSLIAPDIHICLKPRLISLDLAILAGGTRN